MTGTVPLILLVEDEEHLADGLLFNLEAEGYRTRHFADGDEALAWLLTTPDALAAILLDVMLPGADGFTIVRTLRERQLYFPVLMLTARSNPAGRPRRPQRRRRRLPPQALRPRHPPRPPEDHAPPRHLA